MSAPRNDSANPSFPPVLPHACAAITPDQLAQLKAGVRDFTVFRRSIKWSGKSQEEAAAAVGRPVGWFVSRLKAFEEGGWLQAFPLLRLFPKWQVLVGECGMVLDGRPQDVIDFGVQLGWLAALKADLAAREAAQKNSGPGR